MMLPLLSFRQTLVVWGIKLSFFCLFISVFPWWVWVATGLTVSARESLWSIVDKMVMLSTLLRMKIVLFLFIYFSLVGLGCQRPYMAAVMQGNLCGPLRIKWSCYQYQLFWG